MHCFSTVHAVQTHIGKVSLWFKGRKSEDIIVYEAGHFKDPSDCTCNYHLDYCLWSRGEKDCMVWISPGGEKLANLIDGTRGHSQLQSSNPIQLCQVCARPGVPPVQ